VLSQSMTFPRTKQIDTSDGPAASLSYTCNNNRANLEAMTTALKSNPELKAYGSADLLASAMTVIQQSQEEFLPCQLDGFHFHRAGLPVLHLQRVDDTGQSPDNGRSGFVELNELRLRQLQVHRLEGLMARAKGAFRFNRVWNMLGW